MSQPLIVWTSDRRNGEHRSGGQWFQFDDGGFYPVLDFSFSDRERRLRFVNQVENFSERTASAGFKSR